MTRLLWAALLTVALLSVTQAGETLAQRIAQQAERLRELDGRYEEQLAETDRQTILESILKTATWLEQVGGMPSARTTSLLALARWDLLKLGSPPQFGFLADHDGASRPVVMVRTPKKDELPGSLSHFRDRLLFVHLSNESLQPILVEDPYLERPGGLGEPKRSNVILVQDWPPELKALAKWGRWPEQLDASGKAVLLVLLTKEQTRALRFAVPVRWKKDGESKVVRVAFLDRIDPEGLARARQVAVRREARIQKILEDLRRKEKERRSSPAPQPEPQPKPLPPIVGSVEPGGSGRTIQLQLLDASTYRPGKELQVWKNSEHVGSVRFKGSANLGTRKRVYLATIVKGQREVLINGVLRE